LLAVGRWRWSSASSRMDATFISAAGTKPLAPYRESELVGLPAPVARYFRHVLTDGQPMVRVARFAQVGSMRMGDGEETWRPFSATELFTVLPIGMLWDASIRQAPLMPVYVRDSYHAGVGALRAEVLGLATVADFSGAGALAEGEMMRYLAEGVWLPTALLPSAGVTWTALSDSAAIATVHDGAVRTAVEFRFDARDEVSGIYVSARGRVVDGVTSEAPWEGRFWQYARHDGMLIPEQGEVSWVLGGVARPYWRGRTTAATFEFAR
jgi:hypothetical protein